MIQLPALFVFGLMTPTYFFISLAAMLPLITGMPLGAFLAQKLTREHFDKIVQLVLFAVATRLLLDIL